MFFNHKNDFRYIVQWVPPLRIDFSRLGSFIMAAVKNPLCVVVYKALH